jgi:hypothetical protein
MNKDSPYRPGDTPKHGRGWTVGDAEAPDWRRDSQARNGGDEMSQFTVRWQAINSMGGMHRDRTNVPDGHAVEELVKLLLDDEEGMRVEQITIERTNESK